jgi:hypothetical protein
MPSNPLGNMGTSGRAPQPLSVSESETLPATVETCRIINVNIEDWSVDCISAEGNKRFFDIQVMSPYFNFVNGEGIYAQPEVGALCWVCKPSTGRFAAPFVLGFQSAHDQDFDSFQGGRQSLNPGDIMLRTRDENFLTLRRGGVVQIGATPTAQRLFLPIRNFIKDFCENYGLHAFGGELTWTTERTDDTTSSDKAFSKFALKAKEKAGNKLTIANLSIGSHGENSKTTLFLEVFDKGEDGQKSMVSLEVTKEGNVTWLGEKDFKLTFQENIAITSAKKDISVTATKGNITAVADKNVKLESRTTEASLTGKTKASLLSSTKAMLDAPIMHLGDGATSPVVLGDKLVSLLSSLITQIASFQFIPVSGTPAPVIAAPAVASLSGQLQGILSTKSFTK